jgi:predicted  nucleic acid-binding Zn-ribbon protein
VLDFTFNVTADLAKFGLILTELQAVIIELEDLKTKVTDLKSASDAAENLLVLIKTKLDELVQNATDLETLKQELVVVGQQIEAEKNDLAAAVVANTPAA